MYKNLQKVYKAFGEQSGRRKQLGWWNTKNQQLVKSPKKATE